MRSLFNKLVVIQDTAQTGIKQWWVHHFMIWEVD